MDISYNDISKSSNVRQTVGIFMAAFIPIVPGFAFIIIGYMIRKQQKTPTAAHEVGVAAGIYWDQASGPRTVDHNVLWNNYQCDFIHSKTDYQKDTRARTGFIITRLLRTLPYGHTAEKNLTYKQLPMCSM